MKTVFDRLAIPINVPYMTLHLGWETKFLLNLAHILVLYRSYAIHTSDDVDQPAMPSISQLNTSCLSMHRDGTSLSRSVDTFLFLAQSF